MQADEEAQRRTFSSFGYEWTTFDQIEPEDEAFWERYFRDVPLPDLEIERALDAGCGKGRFAFFTARHVANLIALDGSRAVEAAQRNLSTLPNVHVVRSDIRRMPFAAETFHFVYCLGVLHHLPHPIEGFREVSRMIAQGGHLLIYVYSRANERGVRAAGLAAATFLRKFSRGIPYPLLRWMSIPVAAFLWTLVVMPGSIGDRRGIQRLASLPLHTYRRRPFRSLWLDTFDRLSAPLETRYIWDDIEPWFAEAGLEVMSVREDAGLIVLARKRAAR